MICILYNVYFVYLLAYTIRKTFKNTIITIVTDPYYVLATPNTHTKNISNFNMYRLRHNILPPTKITSTLATMKQLAIIL